MTASLCLPRAPPLCEPQLSCGSSQLQVIETRKKEAPYMLPEAVFVEKPR